MDIPTADGLEIIDFSKNGEKDSQNPVEIRLTNGRKVLVHKENAYENYFHDGRSFDDVDSTENSLLQFEFNFQLHKDGLREMKEVGNTIHSNPMAVYHKNVLWCYAYGLTAVKEDNGDLLCLFEMISIGPSFSKKQNEIRGGIGNNCPRNQYAPEIKEISLTLMGSSEIKIPLGRKNDAFVAETLIPLDLLKKIIEHLPTLAMRVQLTIPSSYFNIERLINLNLEQPPTKPSAQKILTIILNGGKPPGYDWVITVAEGSPREFFVHRKVLEDASPTLKVVIHTHTSLPSEQLLMVSHEDRCILTATHASDMKTILTYFYLRQYEIPPYDAFARVGRTLCLLFPQEVILGFFEHWEVAIARDLLQADKHNTCATLRSCAQHLISIFSAPYGAMPVAKRIAVAVMADTWQMAEAHGVNVEEQIKNMRDLPMGFMDKILYSVEKFRTVVSGVRKRSV
uniref:BTB domain-containing protein n=1 Tax=Haemonchus contortus TaxID=6289 RepID=A0A7I4Y5R7_HAECO|nr:Protein ZK418.2, isoform a [Haemonchus contortus]